MSHSGAENDASTGGMLPQGLFDVPPGYVACVVTSLQMLARPAPCRKPDGPGLALRPVANPDPDWYRALFRRIGEDWLWFSRLTLSDAALAAIIQNPRVEVFALTHEGHDQGLLELDFTVPGECELSFFGIAPECTERGYGRWLMAETIARAWAQPIERFWVHTCTLDHPAALPFYVKAGFVPFRRQIEIAEDPRLTGLLRPEAAPDVPRL